MKEKTSKQCVADGDFTTALLRLQKTNDRWEKYWFDCCNVIYEANSHLANEYSKDELNRNFQKRNRFETLTQIYYYDGKTIYTNGKIDLLDTAEQKCYLFRFYDEEQKLVCSKVGTTTKPILIRIKSELREYKKLNVITCVIDRVYDCGKIPAEGMESYFRAEYIRRHPQEFRKNDRFFNVSFNLEEADGIYQEYFRKRA